MRREKVLQIISLRSHDIFEIHFDWSHFCEKIQNYTRIYYSNSKRTGQLWQQNIILHFFCLFVSVLNNFFLNIFFFSNLENPIFPSATLQRSNEIRAIFGGCKKVGNGWSLQWHCPSLSPTLGIFVNGLENFQNVR